MMFKLHDGRWLNTDHIVEIKDEGHGDIRIIMTDHPHEGDIILKEDLDMLCAKINAVSQ